MRIPFLYRWVAVVACLAAGGWPSEATAQQAQAKRAEKIQKVACVDIPAVLESVPESASVRQRLQAKRQEFERAKAELEREIEQLTSQISESRGLRPQEAVELNARLVAKRRELADFVDRSNKELAETEQELLKPVLRRLQNVVRTVAVRNGVGMVLDRSTAVVYVAKEYDLTAAVIEAMKRETEAESMGERRD